MILVYCLNHLLVCYFADRKQPLQALKHAYISPLLSASGEFAAVVKLLALPKAQLKLGALGVVPAPGSRTPAAAWDLCCHGGMPRTERMKRRK